MATDALLGLVEAVHARAVWALPATTDVIAGAVGVPTFTLKVSSTKSLSLNTDEARTVTVAVPTPAPYVRTSLPAESNDAETSVGADEVTE